MRLLGLFFLFLLGGCVTASIESTPELFVESNQLLQDFASSESCNACHPYIYEDFNKSMHKNSFANPVFRAQYLNEVLPRAEKDPVTAEEAKRCIFCHAPTVYMKVRRALSAAEATADKPGVTCDFCHTLSGTTQSGDFLCRPEKKKLGPYERKGSWHSEYGGFITISEFCATCHNDSNHNGLEIKSTYSEWKSSVYARRGIQCQDCHMNTKGYLNPDGKAEYEKGKAAFISIGLGTMQTDEHEKLYTHLFPGAHSKNQVDGIIGLKIVAPSAVNIGEKFSLTISIDNSKTGHKMPSGSSDLRMMYLDVTLESGGKVIHVLAPSKMTIGKPKYDVAMANAEDPAADTGIPAGARIYRTVFVDEAGKITFSSYEAVKVAFDNRLNAAEVRDEVYRLGFDHTAKGSVTVSAKLVYVPYPASFAKKLNIAKAEPVVLATSSRKIIIR